MQLSQGSLDITTVYYFFKLPFLIEIEINLLEEIENNLKRRQNIRMRLKIHVTQFQNIHETNSL